MSEDIEESKIAPATGEAASYLYDYFKHLTSLSILILGGVLAISTDVNAASKSSLLLVIALVAAAAILAFSGTSEVVREKVTGKRKEKSLAFYRISAPIALSLGVGAFLQLFLKGLPA